MTFPSRIAAEQAYKRFVTRYYDGDASALRRAIKATPRGRFEVAIYCGRTGYFLTYL